MTVITPPQVIITPKARSSTVPLYTPCSTTIVDTILLTAHIADFSQTRATTPSIRDKPAAFVEYELTLAKANKPLPTTVRRALRIFMNGVVSTRPCRHCKKVVASPPTNHGADRRGALFGGLCVMPGKSQKEYGGCCACIGAGVPGCSAECRPQSSIAQPLVVIIAHVNFSSRRCRIDSAAVVGGVTNHVYSI